MRILNKQDFLKLPAGIIFRKAGPNSIAFGNLHIKGKSLNNDNFTMLELCNVYYEDFMNNMPGDTLGFDTDGYGRDDTFDDAETFLVLESIDILKLKEILDGAISYEN